MRRLLVGTLAGFLIGGLVSVAFATHEMGHTTVVANGVSKVKIVRHSFPSSIYSGGQWTNDAVASNEAWVQIPGAKTSITIPSGQKAIILVQFNSGLICAGDGKCNFRILIGGVEAQPASMVQLSSGWTTVEVDRSRGPLGPGTYEVAAQASNYYGLSGSQTYMRSYHMTVQRLPV